MIRGGRHRRIGHGITGARRGRSAGTHGGARHGHGVGVLGGVPDGDLPGVRHGHGAGDPDGDPAGDPDGAVWLGTVEIIRPMDVSLQVYAMAIQVSAPRIRARRSTAVLTGVQAM